MEKEKHELDVEVEEDVDHPGTSSVYKATFNMSKTIVGAGVFGLPNAYQKTGFVTVTVLIIALAFIISWTLSVLLAAGLKTKQTTYYHLMKYCFGRAGAVIYGVFAFLFAFGGMAAYTVIIGDTVPIVMRAMLGIASADAELSQSAKILTDRRIVIVLASYLIMFPVSSFRDITKLAKFSVLALTAILGIAALIMADAPAPVKGEVFTVLKPSGLMGAIGTLCFAYVCHHNTFIIYGSLKERTFGNFKRVINYSLLFAMVISLVVGISGFVLFKDTITSNVLNVFSNTDTMANVARALFAIDMFLTYPLELYVARNTIYKIFLSEQASVGFHLLVTFLLISFTTMIGVLTCDLGAVFDITGGVAAAAIAFIFPSACTIVLGEKPYLSAKNAVHIICLTCGVAILLLTTYKAIEESMTPSHVQCKFKNF